MDNKAKTEEIIRRLGKEYPSPKTALVYGSPFELLVATILSAQTTDAQVNKVTGKLFRTYRSIEDYATVLLETLRKDVSAVNFYNNKAKNIQESARMILRDFGGSIPKSMEEITKLPGVARKTGNILLSSIYGVNEGIAVDTHVKRLSGRLGLTRFEDPVKIERDLMALAPRMDWAVLSHLLILHGRKVCQARKPAHKVCVLRDICPSKDM